MTDKLETDNKKDVSLQSNISANIERHMKGQKGIYGGVDLSDIKTLRPYTWIVVTDPRQGARCFGIVNFDRNSFSIFERSIPEIRTEKGITLTPRLLVDLYEINVISDEEVSRVANDVDIGGVYIKVAKKIRALSKKNYGVEVDSALTTLNAMLSLHLVPSENVEGLSFDECKELAKNTTDHQINSAAWLALRKREAVFMIERDQMALLM